MNKASIERGLFCATSYRTLMDEERKQGTYNFETICIPPVDKRKSNANYGFLDEKGLVKKRIDGKPVYVNKGDVIIGKVLTKSNKNGDEELFDCSYVIKSGEEGFIDRVLETVTPNGYKMIKVTIRNQRIPEIGDKLASRSAQKGTCIYEDTLVSLVSGLSKKICDISIGDKLWGYNGSGLCISSCTNKAYMGIKETLCIEFINGRELICTKDHKIMTDKGWKKAEELTIDDKVASNLHCPLDYIKEDEKNWSLTLSFNQSIKKKDYINSFVLKMDTEIERERSLIFARILGYILADGWLCKSSRNHNLFRCGVSLGTKIDCEIFITDFNKLISGMKYNNELIESRSEARFYDSKSYAGSCFVYDLPSCFANLLSSIDGIMIGRRTSTTPKLPTFLYSAPLSIIREFLGGLFGGDGCSPYISNNEIQCCQFSWKVKEIYLDDMKQVFNDISNFLKKFNVYSSISKPFLRKQSNAKDGLDRYRITMCLSRCSLFFENIGFRYCINKQVRLSVASDFWKSKSHLSDIKERTFTKGKISSKDFLIKTDTKSFFDKCKHLINRYDNEVPVYYLPIIKITNAGVKRVYDITVDKAESFIANGVLVHNCGMIYPQEDMPFSATGLSPDILINSLCIPSRMTISQLLETCLGKSCCIEGTLGDATPFSSNSSNIAEQICDRLQKNGYERHGWEQLYNGMTGEVIEAQIFFGPVFYQRLKHMVSDKIHCCAIDTEVLTFNGWKKASEIRMNDHIATLKDGKLVYEEPTDIMIYPDYEGSMYYIKNKHLDIAVTGNHRMWVSEIHKRSQTWKPYDFTRADTIIGKHLKYKKDAIWDKDEHELSIQGVNVPDENRNDWLTFIGLFYSQHCIKGFDFSGNIFIRIPGNISDLSLTSSLYKCGFVEQDDDVFVFGILSILYICWLIIFIDDLRSIMASYIFFIMMALLCRDYNKLSLTNYQIYRYMKSLDKYELPEWVLELSKEQARVFIKGMLIGNKKVYYTSSVKLADQFQQLCLHAGWTGVISTYIKEGEQVKEFRGKDIVNKNDILRIDVITRRMNPSVNHHGNVNSNEEERFVEKEKCPVFCLQVPSEVFYIRRNGKTCWTGNSRSQGHVTTLTRQPLEGRSRDGGKNFMPQWYVKILLVRVVKGNTFKFRGNLF
jgi:intein/homing endonuclease